MAKKKKNKAKNKVTAKNKNAVFSDTVGAKKKDENIKIKSDHKGNGRKVTPIEAVIIPVPPRKDRPEIKLTEKIHLEKSSHSYRSFIHRRYGKYFKRVEKPARVVLKISLLIFGFIIISLASLFIVFGRDLPDVSKLKTMNFYETTRIYDREGNLLYSIFGEENRKYVPLNFIAPLAVDATLSIEDKNFYRHFGFDPAGIVRAQMKNIQDDSITQGASTITQQLAKNIFLSPERTYDRKIKELLLALQIEWMYSKNDILEMYLNKIAYGSNSYGIEAAAGTFFGKTSRELNLAESAVLASLPKAPSYFSPYGQNRKELMGYCGNGSILPQTMELVHEEDFLTPITQENAGSDGTGAPKPVQPVKAGAATLKISAKNTIWIQVTADGKIQQSTLKKGEEKSFDFADSIRLSLGNTNADISINGKSIGALDKRVLTYKAKDYIAPAAEQPSAGQSAEQTAPGTNLQQPAAVEEELPPDATANPVCSSPTDPNYVWGRKDFVLQRMVEDGYISKTQMEEAWKDGLTLKFKDPMHKIEAPHFVFYVKELLEQKYGKELVENGGLEVKTSLDPVMQSLAEEAVSAHAADNLRIYKANNAALVAIDPRTGQVNAMVGSVDYWDAKIDGQVNVATSPRQPGSSFKPLVYAAAMQKAGLGSGTILSDYKTVFNKKDVPHNADNAYKGRMNIRTALANSRNIPAIKAYYLAGEEEEMLNFLDKVGLQALRKFRDDFNKDAATRGWTFFYGWPMAIGSGEVKLVDLAGAYGALANGGRFVPVNPILEVRDRKGNILEKFQQTEGTQVMDPQVAFIISDILSDVYAKPAGSWRNSMTIDGYTIASKTGTSNKKVGRGIYPNNNILMGYTPEIVTAVWVGNTDGSRMHGNAWAFADAGPIWKQFLTAVLKDKKDVPFPKPPDLKWIGREVYPSFADLKTDFDKRFKRIDSQESIESLESMEALISGYTESSWVTTDNPSTPSSPSSNPPLNGEAPVTNEPPPANLPPPGF